MCADAPQLLLSCCTVLSTTHAPSAASLSRFRRCCCAGRHCCAPVLGQDCTLLSAGLPALLSAACGVSHGPTTLLLSSDPFTWPRSRPLLWSAPAVGGGLLLVPPTVRPLPPCLLRCAMAPAMLCHAVLCGAVSHLDAWE